MGKHCPLARFRKIFSKAVGCLFDARKSDGGRFFEKAIVLCIFKKITVDFDDLFLERDFLVGVLRDVRFDSVVAHSYLDVAENVPVRLQLPEIFDQFFAVRYAGI